MDTEWATPAKMIRLASADTNVYPTLDHEGIVRYVLSRQTPEGGYSYYRTPNWGVEEPNAPDTLAALECLRILHVDLPEPALTGRWLRELQGNDGGYPSLMIGWATLRSTALLGIEPTYSPVAWLGQFIEPRLLRKIPQDWCGALHDLNRFVQLAPMVGLGPRDIDKVAIQWILGQARDHNGGWARPGPELETTAVALGIAAYCQLDLFQDAAVNNFLTRCEDETLGLRISPSGRATSVDALWGGLKIARSLGRSPAYPQSIARSIVLLQRPNGGLGARHRSISTLQATWSGLEASDMLLTKLQEE